jgi:hypothetical protein
MPVVDPADRVAQLAGHPAGKLPPDALVQIHQCAFMPRQRRMGAEEQRPQLLIGPFLPQQLFQPVNGLFDPGLPAAVKLAVDNAPVQAVPVPLEIAIGVDEEPIVLLVLELLGRIGMPHCVQLQQLLIDLAVVIVFIVNIGHVVDVVLPDTGLENKGIDLYFVQPA